MLSSQETLNLTTDASGKASGSVVSGEDETDTWNDARTDDDNVSTNGSGSDPVNETTNNTGTQAIQMTATVTLTNGSGSVQSNDTTQTASSTGVTESDGQSSYAQTTTDNGPATASMDSASDAADTETSGDNPVTTTTGTPTGAFAAEEDAAAASPAATPGVEEAVAANEPPQIVLGGNLQQIPAATVQALINDHMATLYEKADGVSTVYFADVTPVGYVVMFLQSYQQDGQSYYKVAYSKLVPFLTPNENIANGVSGQRSTESAMRYYGDYKIQPNLQKMYDLLANGTTGMLHVVPVGALIDNAQQGNRVEAGLSAAGDAAGFLGSLGSLVKGARTARNLRIAAAGVQGGLGATRLGQGFYAVYNGQNNQAAGYFGEGILRLLGASAASVRLLKARAAAQAVAEAAPQTLHGVGPSKGIIELSPRVESTAVFQDNIAKTTGGREFVFDPETNTFLLATKSNAGRGALSPHQVLADSIGKRNSNQIVGGTLNTRTGIIQTGESSGHYGRNWTPQVREQFVKFMRSMGFEVEHPPWIN